MSYIFFLNFTVVSNCLLIVELWSIISPHYVLHHVMSIARFLVNLSEFVKVVSQLVPSWQQNHSILIHLSTFQVTAVIQNKVFQYTTKSKYILWFPLIISYKSTTTRGNTGTTMNQIVTQIEIPVLWTILVTIGAVVIINGRSHELNSFVWCPLLMYSTVIIH